LWAFLLLFFILEWGPHIKEMPSMEMVTAAEAILVQGILILRESIWPECIDRGISKLSKAPGFNFRSVRVTSPAQLLEKERERGTKYE
jgi:hypothetical protein